MILSPHPLTRERVMRVLALLIATAALSAATGPAAAASRDDWDACEAGDPDRSIAACTRIIQGRGETAKNSAIAHYNRGVAYMGRKIGWLAVQNFMQPANTPATR
jgi:hypothetical protein